jgi:hypothetical protein
MSKIRTTYRSTPKGARITTKIKQGNSTRTITYGAGKKTRNTMTMRTGKSTLTKSY